MEWTSVLLWVLWVILTLLKLILWILGSFIFALWWRQSMILYLPNPQGGRASKEKRHLSNNPPGYRNPGELGLQYEEIWITTRDNTRLHSFLITQPAREKCPTIIFFHGNAGNIGHRLPNAHDMYLHAGANILLLEYRGYGNSEGSPSEEGLKMDALAAFEMIRKRQDLDSRRIMLFGRSLGGGVAIWLASHHPNQIAGVIIENTFLSIDHMALVLASRMGLKSAVGSTLLRAILFLFITNHWRSDWAIGHVRAPTLFISGLSDELIPPAHMQALHSTAITTRFKQLYEVPRGTHNDTHAQDPEEYYDVFAKFVQRALAER